MYYYSESSSAGVTHLTSPQSTEAAARQAVEPQVHGDEFHPKPNPDIEALTKRLNELDKRNTEICDKLWMGETPNWSESEELRDEQRKVDTERSSIQTQLSEIYEAYETDGGGPLTGDARVIGSDGKG